MESRSNPFTPQPPQSSGGPVYPAAQSPIHTTGGKATVEPIPFHIQRTVVTETFQVLQDRIQEYQKAYAEVSRMMIGHPEYRPAVGHLYDCFQNLSSAHEQFLTQTTFHL